MTEYNPKFETYQGADIPIPFTIYDADGYTPTNITGWTLEANFMPHSTGNTDESLEKTTGDGIEFTVAASGTGVITIPAEESAEMAAGDWSFDLWRTDTGTKYPVALGSFTLSETPRSRSSDT